VKDKRRGFTLIELIIVITIVGILAIVALPKYFANIERAKKSEAVATMASIREAVMGYYAAYGAYPADSTWPITVSISGEEVLKVVQPSSANFTYDFISAANVTATAAATTLCTYNMSITTGKVVGMDGTGTCPASLK